MTENTKHLKVKRQSHDALCKRNGNLKSQKININDFVEKTNHRNSHNSLWLHNKTANAINYINKHVFFCQLVNLILKLISKGMQYYF